MDTSFFNYVHIFYWASIIDLNDDSRLNSIDRHLNNENSTGDNTKICVLH